ncbi:MAG: 2-hydroxymuconate tautomerase family protein [Defluviitaleaceae bacterium]|nr:2-hydroxymuconate tautomerase family protein [Defluviitaleaceae bacterium]
MPLINIKMLEGRTLEQKKELVKKVTDAVASTTGSTPERISIVIEEMPKHHFARAGVLESEK